MAVETYKCKNCDGGLIFDPDKQKFICEYCGSEFTLEELEGAGPDSAKEQDGSQAQSQDGVVYVCPSCGAEIVTDATTAATFCFYCHNPVVLAGRLDDEYLPDKVIPFAFGKDEAIKKFMAWIKSKRFVPKEYFTKENMELISGVYFPYWIVDTDVSGLCEAHGTKVRYWRTGNTEYTETSHYAVTRGGNLFFNDITKSALDKVDKLLVESVQPFDGEKMVEFSKEYLQGFAAEKRNIEKDALAQDVNNDVNQYTSRILQENMNGYATITGVNTRADIKKQKWDYVLLPVWVLTYKGEVKGKKYYFALNGQTGKANGMLPIDKGKLLRLFGILAGAIFAVLMILGYFI